MPDLDVFTPLVGERFAVTAADATTEMTLAEAQALPSSGERTPFELIFRSQPGTAWPQGTYRFSHAATGDVEMFVVPIAGNAGGTTYQAIFN